MCLNFHVTFKIHVRKIFHVTEMLKSCADICWKNSCHWKVEIHVPILYIHTYTVAAVIKQVDDCRLTYI